MKEVQAVIDTTDTGEAHQWARRFYDVIGHLDDSQVEERTHLEALGAACVPMLTLSSTEGPYGTAEIIPSSQGINKVGQFHAEHMDALKAYTGDEVPAELRARCADLLWTLLREDYTLAGIACDAYLEVAKDRSDPNHWTTPFKRIERAWKLASSINDKGRMEEIRDYIDELLAEFAGKDPKFFTTNLLELMLEIRPKNPEKYAALSSQAAEFSAKDGDHRKARGLWELAAKWSHRAKQSTDESDAKLKAARTYVAEAEASGSNLVKASFLSDAVTALKRAGADTTEVKAIQKKLISANRKSSGEMAGIGFEIPLAGIIKHAEESMDVDHPYQAILNLVTMPGTPTVPNLRQTAERRLKETTFMHLMGATVVNREGKQMGTVPPAASGDLSQDEQVIQYVMAREMAQETAITAQGWIHAAMEALNRKYPLTKQFWGSLFAQSAIIPPDRVAVWAKAYYYLSNGDIETAVHIIAPQLEQGIRFRLETAGAVVTRHTDDGGQEELLLGDLLWMPEFVEVFGDDYAFLLRHYLQEKTSLNLRNQIGHGLASSNALNGANALYLAWLALRIVLDPTLATAQPEPELPSEPKEPHIIRADEEE